MNYREELQALRAEIAAHNRAYYDEDAPTISDFAYDALMRRLGKSSSMPSEELISGPFTLNLKSRTLLKNGVRIELTQVEYMIVKTFLENSSRAMSRDEILKTVWGQEYYGDLKIVDVNIRRLRLKIEENPASPQYISTVWGFGYKWEA